MILMLLSNPSASNLTKAVQPGDMPTLRRQVTTMVALITLFAAACGGDDTTDGPTTADRQDAVAERGAEVMAFDLDATTHAFRPTDDGLVEDVTADDAEDGENILLIREHLADERERFARGDYGDPAQIHGDEMPGLAELEAGADEIEIFYEVLDDGARLTFTADDPALVDALHRWGEAQVTDHGEHAATTPHGDVSRSTAQSAAPTGGGSGTATAVRWLRSRATWPQRSIGAVAVPAEPTAR